MLLLFIAACSTTTPNDTGSTGPIIATDYCEQTVDVFCPFYLRCGWTAADDEDSCRESFLETCNSVYEPRWAALAEAGKLELDADGIAACATHLETLECGAQQNELQGPCAEIWQGQVAAGGGCGIGLESFVCDDDSVCVLDLSFCGTCEPMVADGEVCDTEHRCGMESDCVEGFCVARARLGDACSDAKPCYVGAQCTDGICTDDAWVGLGDDCGAGLECPYTSTCVDGECVADALLGEACTAAACASGWCDGAVCQPFGAEGDGCTAPGECLSGQCSEGGTCGGTVSTCVAE